MTDTNNEWIEQARLTYNEIPIWWKECKDEETAFKQAILYNLPKPTEVVAPVDIEDIIEKIWYVKRYSDTRYFDWEEVKKELRKILSKWTTPVEPINQEKEQLIEQIEALQVEVDFLKYNKNPINQERLSQEEVTNTTEYEKMNYIEKAVYWWRWPRCPEKMDWCCICKAREMYDAMDWECTLAAIRRWDFIENSLQSSEEKVEWE